MVVSGLEGKRVLVTGGAQGIGFAVAQRFAQEGASVFLVDRTDASHLGQAISEVRKVAAKTDAIIDGVKGDVSEEASVDAAFQKAIDALGQVDVLINNAGINRGYSSDEFPTTAFDEVLGVNLRGVFLSSRRAIRHFLERKIKGIIINNSSNHESQPKPGFIAYSVSKGGLGNLTKTLALEFSNRGNAVAPGAGRAAEAPEVAGVFAFLASDDATYITGQTIYVDGGLTLSADYRQNWAS